MGVVTVSCPTCEAPVRFGLPQGSEIQAVIPEATETTDAETKTRPLSCTNGHALAVEFTVG